MVFTRRKLNELSKEELTEELLSFDNLSQKINDLIKSKFDKSLISHQNLIVFFLNCRFPKPAIHYYANKLLIWSCYPWTMLYICKEK